jgi:putative intracellular protease/amidase
MEVAAQRQRAHARQENIMTAPRILIIVTSHGELGTTGKKTGFWMEELAAPYRELTRAGAQVDIASPLGGKPPADPGSMKEPRGEVAEFLSDPEAMRKLDATLRVADILESRDSYDAVFVAGGHGVMWDLATSPAVAELLSRTYQAGRVVAAVCHGPAALVNARKADGTPLVAGHRFTAFSNEEETAAGLTEVVPFLLESRLADQGGKYECAGKWQAFAVRDGLLVTGQNPASSAAAAKETLAAVTALGQGA